MNLNMKERHHQPQMPAIQSQRNSFVKNGNNDAVSQNSAYQQINTAGNCASSVGTAKSQGTLNATVSQNSQKKRVYLYCIDTRQIISMIEYSARMIKVSQ